MIKYLKGKALKISEFHTSFFNCMLMSANAFTLCLILMGCYLGLSKCYAIQTNDINYSAIESLRLARYLFFPFLAICFYYFLIAILNLPTSKYKEPLKEEDFYKEIIGCIQVSFCSLLLVLIFLIAN